VFLVGSTLCGAATSIWFLIGARFLQGFGGGGLTAMTMIIPGDIVQPKDRPQIFAFLGIIAGLGSLLGPILGGALTDAYSWRLIFYVNLPPGIFSFVLAWFSMKRFEVPKKRLRLDYTGSVLIAIATISLILFITWGGEESIGYPWDSPQIIALILICAVSFTLFIFQEYYHELPTLQLRLHKIRNVWINFAIVFFSYYSMISVVNYMSVYFQEVKGNIAVISGLKLGGFVGGFILMSRLSGKILMKTRKANFIMSLSCLLLALGIGLLHLLSPTLNYGYIFLFTTIMGIGTGFVVPASGAMIQLSVPQRDIAVAMSNYSFDCYIGGCIGVTVAGTIVTRTSQRLLQEGFTYAEATSAGIGNALLWCVPPMVLVAFFALFLTPVKQKKIPIAPQPTEQDFITTKTQIELTETTTKSDLTDHQVEFPSSHHRVDIRETN